MSPLGPLDSHRSILTRGAHVAAFDVERFISVGLTLVRSRSRSRAGIETDHDDGFARAAKQVSRICSLVRVFSFRSRLATASTSGQNRATRFSARICSR